MFIVKVYTFKQMENPPKQFRFVSSIHLVKSSQKAGWRNQ